MAIAIPRALERVAQDAELGVAPDERDRLRAARTAELGETPRVDRRRQWAYADNVRHNRGSAARCTRYRRLCAGCAAAIAANPSAGNAYRSGVLAPPALPLDRLARDG
ncbi:MAG: hypothetical protein DLM71_09145 [Chloroflexi bacterium]|nr:MAG: hypothetical protein DLM71_09145 [Chloroflexota bacterium]